jgi:hypothetical protein
MSGTGSASAFSRPTKSIIGKAYSRQEINFEAFPQHDAVEMGILALSGWLAVIAAGPILPRLTPRLQLLQTDLVPTWGEREPHCGSLWSSHGQFSLGLPCPHLKVQSTGSPSHTPALDTLLLPLG